MVAILAVADLAQIGDTMKKNTFCSYCGEEFNALTYPLTCEECKNVTYINPCPVNVVCVQVGSYGVLVVRRNHEPGKGKFALPGGFLEVNESWQAGAAREVMEETGVKINAGSIRALDVHTSEQTGHLIVYSASNTPIAELPPFVPNEEVTEIAVVRVTDDIDWAFPRHGEVARLFLESL